MSRFLLVYPGDDLAEGVIPDAPAMPYSRNSQHGDHEASCGERFAPGSAPMTFDHI
jgi:hypothetical protein